MTPTPTPTVPSFYPVVPSLRQDTQRVWALRHLHQQGTLGLHRWDALQTLSEIEERTPSPRLRALCLATAIAMFPEVADLFDPGPAAAVGIGTYAR